MKSKNKVSEVEFLHRTREAERASCVADELRNPITSILTCLEMLPTKVGDSIKEEDLKLISLIREETNRLGHLIQEIVSCSRDCGVEPSLVSLNTIIRSVARKKESETRRIGHEFAVQMDREIKVRGNVLQLERVVEALLDNSVEALGSKPGKIVLEHGVDEDRNWHLLRIRDDGPGIPAELGDRVFERFVSSNENKVGLGLAVAKQVVKAHGGDIVWLENEVGCCLEVRFPFYEVEDELGRLAV